VKTIDLSDFPWEEHGGTYDEDDRLRTNLGPAEVTIDFSAKRIGLKVWKDGSEQSYCCPLDQVPIDLLGDWRPAGVQAK
jgi:hypothetical protein